MDIRYSASPRDVKRYTTQELRDEFLIQNLYVPDSVQAVYSHVDRMVVMGVMPVSEKVPIHKGIDVWANFGTSFFLERREAGVFNLGGRGFIEVDGERYGLGYEDCLYISKGAREVYFGSEDAAHPAKFYLASTPAHKECKTTLLTMEKANHRPCGEKALANERVINQFIHPDVLKTCQLSMGMTVLEEGSVWNTMPAHVHSRRMEAYFYFEVPEEHAVCHFMGEPQHTRHIWMRGEQAVLSPEWSIHSAAATHNYTFIWGMGGENLDYGDQDFSAITDLR